MKKVRINLIKMLSGLLMAAFFVSVGFRMDTMTVHAQSHENKDVEGPVINSAISNGKLRVEAFDQAGVKAIYVNEYEYTDITDGVLSIRLQQFDSGYEKFKLRAIDNLGNESFDYYIDNPYFQGSDEKAVSELPADAKPSVKGEAKADVKDYTEVKGDEDSLKIFYTFETENGKQFYLIIDRTGNIDTVHFVTDVSENDLLNTTSNNSETLPKNSAALSSSKLTTQNVKEERTEGKAIPIEEINLEKDSEIPPEPTIEPDESEKTINVDKPMGTYIVLGIVAVIVIIGAYYFKVVKKKDQFLDEDDDTEDEPEVFEKDEDAEAQNEKFFNGAD